MSMYGLGWCLCPIDTELMMLVHVRIGSAAEAKRCPLFADWYYCIWWQHSWLLKQRPAKRFGGNDSCTSLKQPSCKRIGSYTSKSCTLQRIEDFHPRTRSSCTRTPHTNSSGIRTSCTCTLHTCQSSLCGRGDSWSTPPLACRNNSSTAVRNASGMLSASRSPSCVDASSGEADYQNRERVTGKIQSERRDKNPSRATVCPCKKRHSTDTSMSGAKSVNGKETGRTHLSYSSGEFPAVYSADTGDVALARNGTGTFPLSPERFLFRGNDNGHVSDESSARKLECRQQRCLVRIQEMKYGAGCMLGNETDTVLLDGSRLRNRLQDVETTCTPGISLASCDRGGDAKQPLQRVDKAVQNGIVGKPGPLKTSPFMSMLVDSDSLSGRSGVIKSKYVDKTVQTVTRSFIELNKLKRYWTFSCFFFQEHWKCKNSVSLQQHACALRM